MYLTINKKIIVRKFYFLKDWYSIHLKKKNWLNNMVMCLVLYNNRKGDDGCTSRFKTCVNTLTIRPHQFGKAIIFIFFLPVNYPLFKITFQN